jgi:hypothetical protein
MIMSTLALLKKHPNPSDADIDAEGDQCLPLQHVPPNPEGDSSGRRLDEGERVTSA